MSLVLYGSTRSSPCRTVLMGIKQLNLEVDLKSLDMKNKEHHSEWFLKLNPAHTIPTLVDGDFSLWESRAILQYLFNKYSPDSTLYPKDPKKRAVIDRMLNFDMSLASAIRNGRKNPHNNKEPNEQQIKNFKDNLKLLDTLIGDNKHVVGNELTIADIALLSTITSLASNDYQDLNELTHLKAWFEHMKTDLPYYEEVEGWITQARAAMAAHAH